jgi:hypothetical protein
MKFGPLLVLTFLFLSTTTSHSHSKQTTEAKTSDSTVEALITKMENDRIQAGVRKDTSAISAMTAEDYVMIDFDGKVQSKSTTLERLKSSEIQLKSNSLDKIKIRVYDNTAIVTGRATPNGTISRRDFNQAIRYTRVYVKKNGQWQVVSFQQTRVSTGD